MVDKIIDINHQQYQLLEELGRGSYGCLFLSQSLADNSYVAIKVLCKTGLDHQQLELQQLEIDIQTSLKHPNLLTLHDTSQDKDYIYMVMELCDQGDLFDYVIRTKMQEDQVANIFVQILEAVEHMHAHNVYHRDIKLENILLKSSTLEDDDEKLECKVADFGLATRERFNMEFGCGSTAYLAPEHFDDDEWNSSRGEQLLAYDAAASDVWSLGILLIALLVGRNPWQEATSLDHVYNEYRRNPQILKDDLFPSISMRCYRILKSVLSPNPADRPTVTELKHQFLALDRLTVDDLEDESSDTMSCDDEDYCYPVGIPTAFGAAKKTDKVSFDSAVFSGTYHAGSGESWSDMVEQDEQVADDISSSSSSCPSSYDDEEDTDMFVHTQEKGSWWL
ncbi:kinase-like domain-containing protein [Dichotomocladium elegans]|nr:kinase-like domain-containing protein [Dichotomocladium elegans]